MNIPECRIADVGFRWDAERQHHVPQLVVEFEPVPANSPNDAKGWKDCDALAKLLAAAPPAPAARQLHSSSSIDCEALIAAVLPGGSICDTQQVADSIRSYLNARPPAPAAQASEPIDMVLHCPACGLQHVDAPEAGSGYDLSGPDDAETRWSNPEWTNPPHRSHLCHGCGHIWRPADVATNGVAAVKTKGKADSSPPQAQQGLQAPLSDPGAQEGEHWPPGMLQDDSRELSRWLASKPDARQLVREAAARILERPVR